jgi:RNA-directed DNA polymerase
MRVQANNQMAVIASFRVLDEAYAWLRHQHLDAPANRPFWAMSLQWPTVRAQLRLQLQAGDYHFSPLEHVQLQNGEWISRWQPTDAIVLKAMTLVLTPFMSQAMNLKAATHLKGNGGLKAAVRSTERFAQSNQFVIKTDIADYYASISHHRLHEMLCDVIHDRRVQRLLWQVMNRVHVTRGEHRLIEHKSIPRGCPISPLLGAIYLWPLDEMARKHQLSYVRYMDDIVIFSKTRHQLKRIIKGVYACLDELALTLAHDKTWIGRVSKGFDFLGYHISLNGLSMAKRSFDRMSVKLHRLFEQGADHARLVQYLQHWIRWAKTGVSLHVKALTLKITEILRNTLHVHVPLKSQ